MNGCTADDVHSHSASEEARRLNQAATLTELLGRPALRFQHRALFLAAALLTLILGWVSPTLAQSEDERTLRIVTKEIEPFVFVEGDVAIGFSIDLWSAIAKDLGIPYQLEIVENIDEQLDAVVSEEADAGIAAISITSDREMIMDFSFPYFESGLGILAQKSARPSLTTLLAAAFTPAILRLLAGMAVLVLLAGHLVWFLERKSAGDFSQGYPRGVWEGIWWAAATVTTVGYGDHVPRRSLGRAFGLIWMLSGVFILANFTANVTTELTVSRLQTSISGPQDLVGKRIYTVGGSTADRWLTDQGISHRSVSQIDEAYEQLANGNAQAIVYDYPVLLYYTLSAGEGKTEVIGEPFQQEDYGIALPEGSPLREEVNRALLHLIEQGTYDEIATRWFGVIESQ